MIIDVRTLKVTQNGFRNPENILRLVMHLRKGLNFDENFSKSLIYISKIEDELYIHDGHHRIASKVINKDYILSPSEFQIFDWEYNDYNRIDLSLGYVTPFDLRKELRLFDVLDFKQKVFNLPVHLQEEYIFKNKNLFCQKRKDIYYIEDLLETI